MRLPTSIVLVFILFSAGSCLYPKKPKPRDPCSYMVLKNPAVPKPGTPDCYAIKPKLTQTAEFMESYKFVRLIQAHYPPDLILVVTPKANSLPVPLLVKSGKAGEMVFKPVRHTLDYGGKHRYTFGRFAVEAIEGIREVKEWPFRLILAIDKR